MMDEFLTIESLLWLPFHVNAAGACDEKAMDLLYMSDKFRNKFESSVAVQRITLEWQRLFIIHTFSAGVHRLKGNKRAGLDRLVNSGKCDWFLFRCKFLFTGMLLAIYVRFPHKLSVAMSITYLNETFMKRNKNGNYFGMYIKLFILCL